MNAVGILDDIGTVLEDYEAGEDAMRWAPGRVICDGGQPLRIEHWSPWRYGTYYITVEPSPAALAEFGRAMGVTLNLCAEHLRAFGQVLAKALLPVHQLALTLAHDWDAADRPRWHKRHCPRCNPWGNPLPSAGHYKPGPKAARMSGRRR